MSNEVELNVNLVDALRELVLKGVLQEIAMVCLTVSKARAATAQQKIQSAATYKALEGITKSPLQ
jgi:hypothetical protein